MTIAQVLKQYAAAWKAGDLSRALDCYHDDFTIHYFGESPLAGEHRGKPAAVAALMEATRLSNRQLLEVQDVLAGDDFGALVVTERLGPDGGTREARRLLLFRVRDDKLFECWLYDEDQRAVDRLWSNV